MAASRDGARVALVEPSSHLGGMLAGGLARTDVDEQERLIGGLGRELFARIGRAYGRAIAWRFEPHVAREALERWLDEARVEVALATPLATVARSGARVVRAAGFDARVFVDASYEGDLLAAAGVPYIVGRESRAEFAESLAGRQENAPFAGKQFDVAVSPFAEDGRLLPLVHGGDPGLPGQGDAKVQAYCYRLCVSTRADRVPIDAPPGYDPDRFELLARYLRVKDGLAFTDIVWPSALPGECYDLNDKGAISLNHIGASWEYPHASDARRREIAGEHERYERGLLYFLAHDARVPRRIRDDASRYGLARAEFAETDHWPPQLYVREARRMRGAYVLRQRDLTTDRAKPDGVALAGYNIDSMPVQRIPIVVQRSPGAFGAVLNEGYLTTRVAPYAIPYRSLVPGRADCDNLIVPVCVSATHVAYSSLRMEPNYAVLGHAAGVAAALAARADVAVQDVAVGTLRERLRAQGAVLDAEG